MSYVWAILSLLGAGVCALLARLGGIFSLLAWIAPRKKDAAIGCALVGVLTLGVVMVGLHFLERAWELAFW